MILVILTGLLACSHAVIIDTPLGQIEGNVVSLNGQPNTHVRSFLGVRYAQPPVGDLRFAMSIKKHVISLLF